MRIDPFRAFVGWLLAAFTVPCLAVTPGEFQVSAQIEAGCLVNAGIPADGADLGDLGILDFGTHSSLSTATVQASLIRNAGVVLSCTPGTELAMQVDGGQNFNGNRRLRLDADTLLSYRIFRQANCTDEIPVSLDLQIDTTNSSDNVVIPIHGCVVLPGNAEPGTYQDTLVVTVTW